MSLPTPEQRLRYYLGSILSQPGVFFDLALGRYSREHLQTLSDLSPKNKDEPVYQRGYARAAYDGPLRELIKSGGYGNKPFLYAGNDRISPDYGPVLVKNRRGSTEPVILRCLNAQRHWGVVATLDRPFSEKIDKVFWRGGSTGWDYRPSSRMKLVKRWAGVRPDIDIKFSHLCQEYKLPGVRERWRPYVDKLTDISTFIDHKYLISAEGNDKDSGLNWKLRANSVVMMPKPVSQSWLMEPFLKPFVHYVPLRDDFSDLGDKLDWCRANEHRCQFIIKQAHKFMEQFKDIKKEKRLEKRVISIYFSKVRGKPHGSKMSPTEIGKWQPASTFADSTQLQKKRYQITDCPTLMHIGFASHSSRPPPLSRDD